MKWNNSLTRKFVFHLAFVPVWCVCVLNKRRGCIAVQHPFWPHSAIGLAMWRLHARTANNAITQRCWELANERRGPKQIDMARPLVHVKATVSSGSFRDVCLCARHNGNNPLGPLFLHDQQGSCWMSADGCCGRTRFHYEMKPLNTFKVEAETRIDRRFCMHPMCQLSRISALHESLQGTIVAKYRFETNLMINEENTISGNSNCRVVVLLLFACMRISDSNTPSKDDAIYVQNNADYCCPESSEMMRVRASNNEH